MSKKRTLIGTACFPSLGNAIAYYGPYGTDEEEVKRKIRDGEIHIRKPELIYPSDKVRIINEKPGWRYHISTTNY